MGRIPYVSREELNPKYRDLIVSSLQPGKTVNVYAATGNNPEILAGLREFLGSLWASSGLTDRQREIAILTASSEIRSAYEWHQHVAIGRSVGLGDEEIRAIALDDRSGFPRDEQAIMAYTRAVIRGRVTEPVHWATLEEFHVGTMVGLAATAAGYAALGRMIDAFGVTVEEGEKFVGWDLDA